MQLNQLSISYKCHSSIGNSLKLDEMINEVLKTFIEETYAIYGGFYLLENEKQQYILSVGKKLEYDVNKLIQNSKDDEITVCSYDKYLNVLLYRLENSLMIFVYDKDIDLVFISHIFESLRRKLNISINSCLNVRDLENKNEALNSLTSNLQEEVNKAVELNKKKDKQMFEQMKMAQMGELIGNIAHQWRQPLNVISTVATGMKLKKQMSVLEDEDFFSYVDKIVDNSQLLSRTIDEFRDYIKESHTEKDVIIQDRVKMAVNILESSCQLNGIKLIEEYMEKDNIIFRLISGELLQVLISIFTNAKEALIQSENEVKWIKYELRKLQNSVIITIEDNAGGIPESIKDKIFNPYFTTKHQSQGTGIGLYNCYNIVTKHLGGKLYCDNTDEGTKFAIELPVYLNYAI